MIINIDRMTDYFISTSETGNDILDSLEMLDTWFNKETAPSTKDAPVMSNTIDQNINDYCIDTFYFMENKAIPGDRSEPMYRTISWIEDDNEAHY